MIYRGRFAPSPSGRMHLGNIYSALLSWLSIKSKDGEWILRIEDLDRQRCHHEYAEQIEDDLLWFGLNWDEGGSRGGQTGPYFQSERDDFYIEAFNNLNNKGLLYPCFCRRADILASRAPHTTDGNIVYSGICRTLSASQIEQMQQSRKPATRIRVPNEDFSFFDLHFGLQQSNLAQDCGDFIIRRADGNFAYQLAVVVDDALMNVTEVVRGCDLLSSTAQQIFLYKQLNFDIPSFAHLPLLMSVDGHRLAKRDACTDMGWLRDHYSPEKLLGHLAYISHLIDKEEPISLKELLSIFDWDRIPKEKQMAIV